MRIARVRLTPRDEIVDKKKREDKVKEEDLEQHFTKGFGTALYQRPCTKGFGTALCQRIWNTTLPKDLEQRFTKGFGTALYQRIWNSSLPKVFVPKDLDNWDLAPRDWAGVA